MLPKEESLSAKLRALRAKYNYTQAQVAERLNVSQQTYSNYENKDVAVDSKVLKAICEMYEVSADYMLDINVGRPKVSDLAYIEQADDDMLSLLASKLASEVKTFINKPDTDGEEKK